MVADTLDQDSDKMKTYDLARAEHSSFEGILFVDSDELLFCPDSSDSAKDQVSVMITFYADMESYAHYIRSDDITIFKVVLLCMLCIGRSGGNMKWWTISFTKEWMRSA